MGIGRVVAVRRIGERHAVFQQQHLGGARWRKAANADIGPQTQAFLIAWKYAGHLTQRFVDRQNARALQIIRFNCGGGAGRFLQRRAVAHDDDRSCANQIVIGLRRRACRERGKTQSNCRYAHEIPPQDCH